MYKTDKHPHREQVSGSSSSEKFRHISSDILTYKTFTISRSTNQNAHHHPPDKLLNPPLAGAFAACGSGVAALRVFSSSMATSSSPHPSQAEAVALSLTSFACACAFTGAGATGTDRLSLRLLSRPRHQPVHIRHHVTPCDIEEQGFLVGSSGRCLVNRHYSIGEPRGLER